MDDDLLLFWLFCLNEKKMCDGQTNGQTGWQCGSPIATEFVNFQGDLKYKRKKSTILGKPQNFFSFFLETQRRMTIFRLMA